MSTPYIGEIRLFGGNFAPLGWAFCDGATIPISENDTLFNLIGTTYGGDGESTFNLPNLSGRRPVHMGQGPGISQNYQIGEMAGVEQVTLTTQQIPVHSHAVLASSTPGHLATPAGGVIAKHRDHKSFVPSGPGGTQFHSQTLAPTGGSQPHENMPPYLCVSFVISLFGVYPSQT